MTSSPTSRASVAQADWSGSHQFYAFALRLVRAQRRILDRWSEGDDAVKQRLWRELHEAGEGLLFAPEPTGDVKQDAWGLLAEGVRRHPTDPATLAANVNAPAIVTEEAALSALERALSSPPEPQPDYPDEISEEQHAAIDALTAGSQPACPHQFETVSGIDGEADVIECRHCGAWPCDAPAEVRERIARAIHKKRQELGFGGTALWEYEPPLIHEIHLATADAVFAILGSAFAGGGVFRDGLQRIQSRALQAEVFASAGPGTRLKAGECFAEIAADAKTLLDALAQPDAAQPRGDDAALIERVMALIEERLCIIWHPRENRDVFVVELRAALSPLQPSEAVRLGDAAYWKAVEKRLEGRISDERAFALTEAARVARNWNPGRKDRVTEEGIADAIEALKTGKEAGE